MAAAQGISPQQMKPMLEATRANWVAFRNYDGRELIYFTQMLSFHCGIKDIRYGVNGAAAETAFPVPACNPANPFALDAAKDKVYLSVPLGSVTEVTVQVTYADGSKSAAATYTPCGVAGDRTCGKLKQ